MEGKTRNITTIAMLTAMAFVMVTLCRIPIVLFLEYEPKDIIIALGGFIWGPFTAFAVSVIVSLIEMVTVSEDGVLGFVMNVLSTCSFSCTAALIYQKRRTLSGAVLGLCSGTMLMVIVMLLWNYLITPIYMGYPREAVAELLLPAFLPFNLVKGSLNAAVTFLLYKPVTTALRKSGCLAASHHTSTQNRKPVGLWLLSGAVIITCTLLILSFQEII